MPADGRPRGELGREGRVRGGSKSGGGRSGEAEGDASEQKRRRHRRQNKTGAPAATEASPAAALSPLPADPPSKWSLNANLASGVPATEAGSSEEPTPGAAAEGQAGSDAECEDEEVLPTGEESTSALAARVAFHKARKEGFAVEAREFVRAWAGVHGREPTTAECEADCWHRSLTRELSSATKAHRQAQVRLERAQKREQEAAAAASREEEDRAQQERAERREAAAAADGAAASLAAEAEAALRQREADTGLLLDLMGTGRRLIQETGTVIPGAAVGGAIGRAAAGAGADALGGEAQVQSQLLEMMGALQAKMDRMQQTQDEIAEENKRLREAGGRRGARGRGGGDDDDEDEDAAILAQYKLATAAIDAVLEGGTAPSSEQ